jgi:hypothetical protein
MKTFDLDAPVQGEGFKYFESIITEKGEVEFLDPEPDAPTFFIRHPAPIFEEQAAGKKMKHEFVLNPSTRAMERVGYYPEPSAEQARKEREDVIDYSITGWTDLLRPDGSKIEVTRENKIKLSRIPEVNRFIGRCWAILLSARAKDREEEAKNLSTLPSGDPA